MKRLLQPRALIALALALTMLTAACAPATFVDTTDEVVTALGEAQPIIRSLGTGGVIKPELAQQIDKRIEQAIKTGTNLRTAFENKDYISASDLLATLIKETERIASEDATLIPDVTKRTVFLAALAGANIALHRLARNIDKVQRDNPTAVTAARAVMTNEESEQSEKSRTVIERFAAQPAWGRNYKR